MRRTTPDLLGRRQSAYQTTSRVLLGLTILYVVWTNYVMFAGGNLPLTPISLGGGSAGAGFIMFPFGDLIAVLVIWFVVDAALLNLLHLILRTGRRRRPISIPGQASQAAPTAPPHQPHQLHRRHRPQPHHRRSRRTRPRAPSRARRS